MADDDTWTIDQRERYEDPFESLAAGHDGERQSMWTAMPAIIDKVDFKNGTLHAQPAIKSVQRKADGSIEHVEIPVIQDIPIHWQSGGGFTLTHPIKKGDEALLIFSSRSIDNWWQNGGVQKQVDARMHDLSDGFAFVGTRSKPKALKNVSENSTQLRTEDGKAFVEVTANSVRLVVGSAQIVVEDGKINLIAGSIHTVGDTFVGVDNKDEKPKNIIEVILDSPAKRAFTKKAVWFIGALFVLSLLTSSMVA